ncbi:MAG: hemolysin III family protein [Pirellulaceae bacterium]|nr:hemolysin III family protein [Planctomycetaceae bacterium]HIM28860.1 hemolysin III family protein [Planctomycetota bacterium]
MKLENDWVNPFTGWSADPEEAANTLTHGLGFLLSVIGAIAMTICVVRDGDSWRILGCLTFSASLVTVYAMSTLSHSCSASKPKRRFQALDQGFIYLLIVSTHTSFSLAFLRTPPWWIFLAIMWTIALLGFLSKILWAHRVDGIAVWIYVALGWMPVASVFSLVGAVSAIGLWWMLVGGLCYTVGTAFLIFDSRGRYFHAIWHLFVMAGSACHFFVILIFVAPLR